MKSLACVGKVGHIVAPRGRRNATCQHILSIFGQRRIDPRDVFQKRQIYLIDKPAQTSRVNAEITRGREYDPSELPQRGANLFPMIVQALAWGELVIVRR